MCVDVTGPVWAVDTCSIITGLSCQNSQQANTCTLPYLVQHLVAFIMDNSSGKVAAAPCLLLCRGKAGSLSGSSSSVASSSSPISELVGSDDLDFESEEAASPRMAPPEVAAVMGLPLKRFVWVHVYSRCVYVCMDSSHTHELASYYYSTESGDTAGRGLRRIVKLCKRAARHP